MRHAWAFLAVTAVGVSGCGKGADPQGEKAANLPAVRVEQADVTDWLVLSGRLAPPPDRETRLAPLVAGRLTEVRVRQGQAVAAGDVLARLDTGALDDDVTAAEAGTRRAEAEAEYRRRIAVRTRGLVDKGVASRQDAEGDESAAVAAESSLAEARSSLSLARRRRDWAEVRAPFAGVIVTVIRQAGDTVDGTPSTPVVELASPHPVEVAASATAEALARLAPGLPAQVRVGGTESTIPAVVARVARALDPATGVGEVRLSVKDAPAGLVLGAAVEIRVAIEVRKGVLVVPVSALRRNPSGQSEVILIQGAKTEVRVVDVGVRDGDRAEVRSGLREGDRVAGEPIGLDAGMAVTEPR
jgi:RND family efflux transporter MFP subunit